MQGDSDAFNATSSTAAGAVPANASPTLIYSNSTQPTRQNMSPLMAGITGNSFPHNNMMPYLVLNFCIALQGVYPPRT